MPPRLRVLPLALGLAAAVQLGAEQRFTKQDADRFQGKLGRIQTFAAVPKARAARPPTAQTTQLTDTELNSYLRYNLKDQVPVGIVEPLNMVVHVFPIDGELPTLVGATDRRRMAEVFSETLPEALTDRFTIQDIRMTPVNYARRHRCVIRYEIEGLAPGNKLQRREVYGKIATDSQGALIAIDLFL